MKKALLFLLVLASLTLIATTASARMLDGGIVFRSLPVHGRMAR
ncbi:MAG: hypothetical protein ACM3XM_00725 [Mycobacterium leprae]